jgi:signal transduction histidine kinase
VAPLLVDGLAQNYRCLYLGSPDMLAMITTALDERGVNTGAAMSRGALQLSSDRGHLATGRFDPRAMVDGLCTAIDDAVRDGFAGLCATGDMRWELGDDANFDRLLEYEALLEQVFRHRPLRGICQYHRDTLPGRAIRDALLSHRSVFMGDALNHDNLFYIPPELLLDRDAQYGDWMSAQIVRILDAEATRDTALNALRTSEAHQRHLAGQLSELNRDLEQRVAQRTAELEVANRQLEAYAFSVSHDLRAPVRAVRGFSEILAEEHGSSMPPEARTHLDRVLAAGARMDELIEGLLGLSRAMKAEIARERVDLSALAHEVVREFHVADRPAARMVVHEGLIAHGDRVLLRIVLANLLGNAWKFTASSNAARVEFGKRATAGAEQVFFVSDNGAGFDPAQAHRLFGDFQRLHRQDEFPGTGVGLATVRRVIARHGGRIWAEGRVGEGATFTFTLPEA